MKMMLQKGFPLALQSMLFPVANSIIQASVNTMGTDSIAAWGICDKLDMIIWLIADSMGPAMTTYAAQNIGAGKVDRVKKVLLREQLKIKPACLLPPIMGHCSWMKLVI